MAERIAERVAGVTRYTDVPTRPDADDVLRAVNLTGFTRPQLDRVALDLALSTAGTDADVRTRILTALGV